MQPPNKKKSYRAEIPFRILSSLIVRIMQMLESHEIFRIDRAQRAEYFHIKIFGVRNLLRVENAHTKMVLFKKRAVKIPGFFTARACFQRFADRLKNPNTSFDSPKITLSNDI